MKYINQTNIRKLVNSQGKRAGKDFLLQLDIMIENKVKQACEIHNGGKKTLDESIATYIGINKQ
ncbi:MAG: hypothetical protein QY331_07740 [Melioribacteraceae bacterium]|nr:MAG: hypothetical protein QY331_07740 [Melioribacteraceae bacterium]